MDQACFICIPSSSLRGRFCSSVGGRRIGRTRIRHIYLLPNVISADAIAGGRCHRRFGSATLLFVCVKNFPNPACSWVVASSSCPWMLHDGVVRVGGGSRQVHARTGSLRPDKGAISCASSRRTRHQSRPRNRRRYRPLYDTLAAYRRQPSAKSAPRRCIAYRDLDEPNRPTRHQLTRTSAYVRRMAIAGNDLDGSTAHATRLMTRCQIDRDDHLSTTTIGTADRLRRPEIMERSPRDRVRRSALHAPAPRQPGQKCRGRETCSRSAP